MKAFQRPYTEPNVECASAILQFLGDACGDRIVDPEALIALTNYLKANVHRYITHEPFTELAWQRDRE